MDNLLLKVENIVAKGEIACFELFFLCQFVFKKPSAAEVSESVDMRERVNSFQYYKCFLTSLQKMKFENIIAKWAISPFATMFSTLIND